MKTVVTILVILNLAIAAWGLLSAQRRSSSEADLLQSQVNADKLRIIRGEVEPPPSPTETAACIEWSPFGGDELIRAREALSQLQLGDRLVSSGVSVPAGWWVYIPRDKTSQAGPEAKVAELNKLGIKDTYIVQDNSEFSGTISLGIFRTQEGAQRHLETLKARGVRSALVGARQQQLRQTAFYVRAPSEEETRRIYDLQQQFPSTELKRSRCPS